MLRLVGGGCLLLAVAAGVASKTGVVGVMETMAGTGEGGYSGDGGPAAQAKLREPFGVEVDARGDFLICDMANHCIRKIDGRTGTIRTVAGSGQKGDGGDGGPATQARMNEPYGLAVDRDGTYYIVDRLNARIRRVDGKSGILTTIAGTGQAGYSGDGGPGTQAQLSEPNGICLDGRGNLFIADVRGQRVRKVRLDTGAISTAAGTGERKDAGDGGPATVAAVNGPRAVACDRAGNLFICEREGHRVRRVDAKSGIITTVAGTGEKGYSGDNGPALQATFNGPKWITVDRRDNLFVVDTENQCVRRIDAATHVVTTVAGGGKKGPAGDGGPATQAEMDRPHGACVDTENVLYIADSENHRVRRVRLGR
jgi:sugar lactone lactonase YvrE